MLLVSCKSENTNNKIVGKEFFGYWADNLWTYHFKKDGTFVFSSKGHYTNAVEYGIYTIVDDFILLVPNTDWKVLDGVLKTKLKITSDECIRDFNDHYYCLTQDSVNYHTDLVENFQEKTISILDSLPSVRELKREIAINEAHENPVLMIAYTGILVIENIEFQSFALKNTHPSNHRSYSTYLVKKHPFEIYQQNLKGNPLSLLYTATYPPTTTFSTNRSPPETISKK
jgi:hypothetical protein